MDTTSPPVRSEDPENPKSSAPRCRLLDYCLVISLVLLMMLMGSLSIVYVAWEKPSLESTLSAQVQKYQEERNAQLVVDNHELKNGTLEWSTNLVTSTFVGRYFKHDKHEIVVEETGFYFIFSQITLRCVEPSYCEEEGEVSLTVLKNIRKDPILNVNIHINNSNMKNQPSFSGTARHLSAGDRIAAELWTSREMREWHFEPERSVLGLLWIGSYIPGNFHAQRTNSQGQK